MRKKKNNNNEVLNERAWKYKVPKELAKRFADIVNSDNPDFEEAREAIKEVISFVKDKVGDDFYEDDLLEDLDWADFDSEDDVDYYINEMFDVLDGYGVWMEPASFFENRKPIKKKRIKEDYGWEVSYDNIWNLYEDMKEAFGTDELLESIVRAMGTYDLGDILTYICRMNDYDSVYLEGHEDDDEDEDIGLATDDRQAGQWYESKKFNKERLTEAERFTHRIVILPKDSGYNFNSAAQKQLRFKSQKEAEDYMNKLLNNSFAVKLKNKGLSLGIEEIPKKPRRTGTQDPDYKNPFEVGDILYGQFGYSMILPEWYEVVKVTSKQVTLKELSTMIVSHDGYGQAGVERPNVGVYKKDWEGKEKEIRALVKKHNGWWNNRHQNPKENYYVVVDNHILDLWDGEDKSFDTYD